MSTVPVVASRPPVGPAGLIRRHPLPAYFVIAYLGAWLAVLPVLLASNHLGVLPFPLDSTWFTWLGGLTGPTLAAFVVTGLTAGRPGVRDLLSRYVRWRAGFQWYLLVLLGLSALLVVSLAVIFGGASTALLAQKWPQFVIVYAESLLLGALFAGPLGEEPGWRGFAQARMQARYGPPAASAVVGLMHGLWHLPIFLLVSGPPAAGPFNLSRFAINTLGIIFVSVAFAWVFNRARQSILIAVLMHASFNAAPAWLAQSVPNLGRTAGYIPSAIYVIVALVLIVATKVQLGYRPAAEPAVGAPGDGVAEVREAA
jgi:membrane protease YdiL (CAAX protease family)